jgi:CheY-like chemotaxis protein
VIEADPGAGLVKMDRGQLEQTLMNLAINARDAMPRGGTLLIKTSNVELPPGLELSHDDVPSGEYVILEVTDTGTGISDEIRAHMFEPFFTTKQAGKGRGLGLATCYGIVRQAGGFIDVSSVLGAGTTMKIQLPRTHEPLEAVSSRQRPTPRRGVETILLVEDSPAVSRVTARMLELRGYRVLLARHGDEALAMMTSESEPVHLLVTDVVLAGGMSGRELADRLRRLKPELKLLYVSGYTPDVTLTHGVLEHEAELLQKPFTAETLAARVREILDDG